MLAGGVNDDQIAISNMLLRSVFFICVNCFVLISGYFGIRCKLRSFANLMFQMVFWSAVCIALTYLPFVGHQDFPLLTTFISQIANVWFPQAYVILFVLAPLLNAYIENRSPRQLGWFIVGFYTLSTLCGYFLHWRDFNDGMSPLSLIGIYMTGAYIRKSDLKVFHLRPRYDMLLWFAGALFLIMVNGIMYFGLGMKICPFGYLNPVVIAMSVFFFLAFTKINIGTVRWINFIASSVFAVYLFHCNALINPTIASVWRQINTDFGLLWSVPVALLSFILIFVVSIVIDRFRILLFDGLCKLVFCKTR